MCSEYPYGRACDQKLCTLENKGVMKLGTGLCGKVKDLDGLLDTKYSEQEG